jgi:PAS domain S-box-containing protein
MGQATKPDFGAATDALELPIILLAAENTIAGFNPAAARLLRLTPSDVGHSFGTIAALAGMVADIEELTDHVTAGGAAVQREIRTNEGAWFVLRAAPHCGADGKVTGVVLTLTNVSAFRASVEQAIYEREYTKAILNTVIDPLVVLDRDLRVQTANKAFHSLFQLSREHVQGGVLRDLGKGEWDVPELLGRLKGAFAVSSAVGSDEMEPLEVEMTVPMLGHRKMVFNARKLSVAGRRAELILLTAEDITDRRRAERVIRERTAQFEILLNEAPLGVYLVDDEFRLRAVNPTALPVFGNIPDLIGRDFGYVIHTLWQGAAADEIIARFRHTLETGEPHVVPEWTEERRDRGVTEYYQWQIHRIPLPEDRCGVVCYFRDISAEVTTREALANNERRLTEANLRKDEFLATLAHELRNPLMPVRMTLARMRRQTGQPTIDGRQMEMLDRQVTNLERIVDDLLEVSRISSGKIELKKERLDLIVAVNHALESARELITQRKQRVSVTLPMGPLFVGADPVRIEQILTNLLINAAKYTDPGGQIWVSLERAKDHVEIRVKDAGVGIAPDLLPRVFEMFEQGRRDLARSTGGLGIGLSIVKKLTELHGGSVVATSAGVNKGSEFTVRLPAEAEDEVVSPAPSPRERVGAGVSARRILVVDDNVDAAESFADLLRDMGHDVRIAREGRAALEVNREWQAEVIFLDIGLPGMDGYEVARQIRVQNATTRLVALTGYGHESARTMSVAAGFARHLVKPPNIDTVVAVLESLAAAGERSLN